MTLTVPPRGLLTASVLATLRRELEPTGKVHDGQIPKGTEKPRLPYWILYSIAGGGWDGPPLHGPEDDMTFLYQVTAVAGRRDQVELLADMVADVWVGHTETGSYKKEFDEVEGWVIAARLRADVPGGVDREGAAPNVVFTAANRFAITLTPQG